MIVKGITFIEIMERYPTEIAFIDAYIKTRYPNGVQCNHCDSTRVVHRKATPKKFQCNGCNNSFSIFKSTVFQHTHLSLRKWAYIIHLIVNAKKGISACQVHREIGGTYKTSWRICHQVRKAMGALTAKGLLDGIVEMDETYISAKGMRGHAAQVHKPKGRRGDAKTVFGMYDRESDEYRAKVIKKGEGLMRDQIMGSVEENVDQSARIITDGLPTYRHLSRIGYKWHEIINHLHAYVDGDRYTNNMENFWALVKRSIIGSFHHVSLKYLQAYVDEIVFRQNNRQNPAIFDQLMVQTMEAA